MKNIFIKIIPVLIYVFLTGTVIGVQALSENAGSELVRFHIVANSDSENDQLVKWKVREAIFENLDLEEITSKEEALMYFNNNKNVIEEIANAVLLENEMPYIAKVKIEKKMFPVREYESFVLPSGVYDAVSVVLGEGKGKNFFCVMYPSLCMISSISEKTENTHEVLNGIFTEKEAKVLTDTGRRTVVKFKIAEITKKLWQNN